MMQTSWFSAALVGILLGSLGEAPGYATHSTPLLSHKNMSLSSKTDVELAAHAVSAILMDADSGAVLFAKNAEKPLPPASITKTMTMLLVMEALEAGKIRLQDRISASQHASSMGGSQIFLSPGETMTVHELLQGAAVASANDATVALAEHIAGTETQFVSLMNERAQQLGLKETHFVNCTGLPEPSHVTSARDIATIGRMLLQYPRITQYTGMEQGYLRKDSGNPFWLVNTNRLVRFYTGVDGLKTGFTREAGFCLAATAKRGPLRVIAVALGEPNSKTRNAEIAAMLDYAFRTHTRRVLFRANERIAVRHIPGGEPEYVIIRAPREIGVLLKQGEGRQRITTRIKFVDDPKLPLRAHQALGELVIYVGGEQRSRVVLSVPAPVASASGWESVRRWLRDLVTDKEEPKEDSKEEPKEEQKAGADSGSAK